jgi:hypothetical protein
MRRRSRLRWSAFTPTTIAAVIVVLATTACLPVAVRNPSGPAATVPTPPPAVTRTSPPTTQPTNTTGLPYVNPALIPAPSTAVFTADRVRSTTEAPSPSNDGAFRIPCGFSHMNFDDPIVFPGRQGSTHLHTFFGNTGTNYASTADSLATTGGSTCRGGTINRSAYWIPSLIDTREGRPLVPLDPVFYYKNGHMNAAEISPLPAGLRMIVGRSTNTTQPTSNNSIENPYFWYCSNADGSNEGTRYGWIPPDCAAGTLLNLSISFPQCWDGRNLDSPDHKSHLYNGTANTCPSSHPVKLVQISIGFSWLVPAGATSAALRLSSDAYSSTQPGGYSTHADWFNGWKPDVVTAWTRFCINASADCHANLLGDGREFF